MTGGRRGKQDTVSSIRQGVHAGSFRRLAPVLGAWVELMGDRSWWDEDEDAPWWYNERAILSLFAGAVWRSKGWAFEEYSTSKKFLTSRGRGTKAYSGRGDLAFWAKDGNYALEARACHPSLSGGGTALKTVRQALTEACDDVRRSRYRGYLPLGIVFAAPSIAASQWQSWPDRWRELREELLTLPWGVAVAWTFPPWGAKLRVTEQGILYVYPSAMLVMGDARKIR
jgi:hypothetical protein